MIGRPSTAAATTKMDGRTASASSQPMLPSTSVVRLVTERQWHTDVRLLPFLTLWQARWISSKKTVQHSSVQLPTLPRQQTARPRSMSSLRTRTFQAATNRLTATTCSPSSTASNSTKARHSSWTSYLPSTAKVRAV